jgi:hypothetical protein
MGKLADQSRMQAKAPQDRRSLAQLRRRRRKLFGQLAKLDRELARLSPPNPRAPSAEEVDRWIDELSSGLDNLPPLPADFSRADLYDDHD